MNYRKRWTNKEEAKAFLSRCFKENKVMNSYVHNRPMMCKRKDIGSKELIGMHFHNDDMELIKKISLRNPEYTPTFNK